MSPPAVLAERIAVIARQHDDALVVAPALLQVGHETAKARVDSPEPRGIGCAEAGILAVERLLVTPPRVQDVDVHRRQVAEDRPRVRRSRIEVCLEGLEIPAEVCGDAGDTRIRRRHRGRGAQIRGNREVVDGHPVATSVHELLERVHVLDARGEDLPDHAGAGPDRGHAELCAAVPREGIPKDEAVCREVPDVRRKDDGGVVGREVVGPQAVDDEQEDVRPFLRERRGSGRKIHVGDGDPRLADARVDLEEAVVVVVEPGSADEAVGHEIEQGFDRDMVLERRRRLEAGSPVHPATINDARGTATSAPNANAGGTRAARKRPRATDEAPRCPAQQLIGDHPLGTGG